MPTRLVLAALFVFALDAAPASATPIPVGEAYGLAFHAQTCHECWPNTVDPQVVMDGVLTVVAVTNAEFRDPVYGFGPSPLIYTSGILVTDITGTMTVACGQALSIHCAYGGTYALSFPTTNDYGSFLFPFGSLARVLFTANGLSASIFNDRAYNYLYAPGIGQTAMSWSSTRVALVPDTSTSLLLGALGVIGVAWIRRRLVH